LLFISYLPLASDFIVWDFLKRILLAESDRIEFSATDFNETTFPASTADCYQLFFVVYL
jgi:hypothetical protein